MQSLECLPSGGRPEHVRSLRNCGTSWEEIPYEPKAYRNTTTIQITRRRPGKLPPAVKQMTIDPVAEAHQKRTSPLPSRAIGRTEPNLRESLGVTSLQEGADSSSQAASVAASGISVVPSGKRDWLPSAGPCPPQGKSHPKSAVAGWILSSS